MAREYRESRGGLKIRKQDTKDFQRENQHDRNKKPNELTTKVASIGIKAREQKRRSFHGRTVRPVQSRKASSRSIRSRYGVKERRKRDYHSPSVFRSNQMERECTYYATNQIKKEYVRVETRLFSPSCVHR